MKWNIGNVIINSNVVLAPMAGVSNPAYMKICETMGVGYVITELISSEAIVRKNKKTFDMLKGIEKLSIPFAIQIFGNNPDVMGRAAKIIEDMFKPSIIDINFGCPVPKVAVKGGSGSALLKNPIEVGEIVKNVVNSVNCPVTVKIRSGWDSENINAVEVSKICEDNGASLIAIHARTRSQGYSGLSDWNIIKKVKESVDIPVIGNGDIKTISDAKRMIDETKCDAIMIGRAALGNPWFIHECVEYFNKGLIVEKPSNKEKVDMIKGHYNLLKEYIGEKRALLEIRTHALWYLKGIDGVKKYKSLIVSSKKEKEFFEVIEKLKEELCK